jgi:hypothetical protein
MSTRTVLLKTDPRQWRVQQVIAWGWHDGPREGICQFSYPPCVVFFRVMAEQWLQGKFGERLYTLRGVSDGVLNETLSLFEVSAAPNTPVWAPHGAYESEEQRTRIEEGIAKIVENAELEILIVRSSDFEVFADTWLPIKG